MVGVIAVAAVEVSKLGAQGIPDGIDFSDASTVELRDAGGQVVLRGQFADAVEDDDGERERYAAMGPAGGDPDAAGEAEVEVNRREDGTLEQEVEVAVRNVDANSRLTIAIDGVEVGVVTADERGRGELEVEKVS
jgi:hypothetical protein